MEYDACIRQIDNYIKSSSHEPIIVDTPNVESLNKLLERYDAHTFKTIQAGTFVKEDTLQLADLKNALERDNCVTFLSGLTLYLFLLGREALERELKSFLNLRTKGKLIIISYACGEILRKFDSRLFDRQVIMTIEGNWDDLPLLNFYSPTLPPKAKHIEGIDKLSEIMKFIQDGSEIFIVTEKRASDFPDTMFPIKEYSTSYQVINELWPEFKHINEDAGTKENWDKLLSEIDKYKNWSEYAKKELPHLNNVSNGIPSFGKLNPITQWAYYLALRMHTDKGNTYISKVIAKSENFELFKTNCFEYILSHSVSETNYWQLYEERRKVVEHMQEYKEQIREFRKKTNGKGKEALYYMTDLNNAEKEQTIEILYKYGIEYKCSELISILGHTYPDLALYLSPFSSGNENIDGYINLYKYCKVINNITDEMRAMVDTQAKEHQYINWLQPRSLILDKLPKNSAHVKIFFIDAMGVEYLHFLQEKCYEQNLNFDVELARCELPSITSINKKFVEEFETAGYEVTSIKELDETKHGGKESYDYNKTKSPIHIVKELDILNKLVSKLEDLSPQETALIVSDHGASRLAVINESETKHEVVEKGLHSGRCCPKGELKEKPDFAVEGNEYWCIANYDRFAGGRKAQVEVHGGATIEEVTVPIITVRKKVSIKCEIQSKEIEISYNKNAQITLYVSEKSDKISVVVNSMDDATHYPAKASTNAYFYDVILTNIKKAGTYTIDVYLGINLICKGLKFNVKKEGVSEKKLF